MPVQPTLITCDITVSSSQELVTISCAVYVPVAAYVTGALEAFDVDGVPPGKLHAKVVALVLCEPSNTTGWLIQMFVELSVATATGFVNTSIWIVELLVQPFAAVP